MLVLPLPSPLETRHQCFLGRVAVGRFAFSDRWDESGEGLASSCRGFFCCGLYAQSVRNCCGRGRVWGSGAGSGAAWALAPEQGALGSSPEEMASHWHLPGAQ